MMKRKRKEGIGGGENQGTGGRQNVEQNRIDLYWSFGQTSGDQHRASKEILAWS